jgi:hypothetical protein
MRMLAANFTYIFIVLFFILRLIFSDNQSVIANEVFVWPWVIFAIYFYLHHFFDGMQNTCRNIARIHLMANHGLQYEQERYQLLTGLLVPSNLFFQGLLWQLTHLASFISIMVIQGWGIALLAELAIWIVPYFIPINYQKHLSRIQTHLNLTETTWVEFMRHEFMPFPLNTLVTKAIDEKLNPQKWWAEKYDLLVNEKEG